ncbi:MAG: DsrE family protein [Nitrososphaerales archaeon]
MVEGIRNKTLALMLFSSPYRSQYADHLCRIAEKAMEKGYNVEIFLYGDGVHAQMNNQTPKTFFNVGESLKRLAEKGALIKSCLICSQARGYIEGDFDEKLGKYPSSKALNTVEFCTIYGFVDMILKADKLLTFGSS